MGSCGVNVDQMVGVGLREWVVVLMDSSINRDLGVLEMMRGLKSESVFCFIFLRRRNNRLEFSLDGSALILSDRS